MNAFELLKALKAKVETDSQIEESETSVTEIIGNRHISKVVVSREIEGREHKIEVFARVIPQAL